MSDLTPFLQSLRERHVISDVIRPHVKLTRKGRNYSGLCPFHKEKSPSFTVNDEKGFFYCFGCGAHGDIFDFVMQKQNMPFMEAVELLAHLLGLEVPKPQPQAPNESALPKPDLTLYEVMEAACCWYQQQLSLTQGVSARTYLEQRKLHPETISQFRLGYAPERGLQEALQKQGFSKQIMIQAGLVGISEDRGDPYDRFRGRLMFPIWDAKGRVIAFGGRILKEGEPKYLNSPDTPVFNKGKILYAYHKAVPIVRQEKQPLIVVEGYMDVIAMHQAGIKLAVAPLGTALTPEQMGLMWRVCTDPILCFDGDSAGIRAAHRTAQNAMEVLKVGHTLRYCFLPAGEDPDSIIRSHRVGELHQILQRPQPLVDVLWTIFISAHSLSTPEQKATARRDLGYLLKEIADPDVRYFYREELNNRFQALAAPPPRAHGTFGKGRDFSKSQSSSAPVVTTTRTSPNKNYLGTKILLATLINHPTLIEDVAESLIGLGDVAKEYDDLCQAIVSFVSENPSLHEAGLEDALRKGGFGSLLTDLLAPQVYLHAPFAQKSVAKEVALEGWKDVWQRVVANHHLAAEISKTAAVARDRLDQSSWEGLKSLKNQNL
jgi:DNA primase